MNSWSVALQNASDGDRKGSITARRVVWFPLPRCVLARCCPWSSSTSCALRSERVQRAAVGAGRLALQARVELETA